MSLRNRSLSFTLHAYKLIVSPVLHSLGGPGGACRFQPTCSEYAAAALREHGPIRGGWLALLRVLRCQPFCKGGYDPVPPRHSHAGNEAALQDSRALPRAN